MSVIVRLIVSAVQRPPIRQLFGLSVFLSVIWAAAAFGKIGLEWAVALSLSDVAILGPLAVGMLAPKEVRLLPIARRDIWRAGWCFSTIVAPAATTIVMCAGLLFAAAFGGDKVPLSLIGLAGLLAVVYAGALIAVVPFFNWSSHKAASGFGLWPYGALAVVATLLGVGGMVWPLVFHSWMPTRWEDLQGLTALVVAVGGAMCMGGYFLRQTSSLPPRRVTARGSGSRRAEVRSRVGQLTGLSRLFVSDAFATGIAASGVLLLLIGLGAVMPAFGSDDNFASDLGLYPFDTVNPLGRSSSSMLAFLGYLCINSRIVPGCDAVATLLRHLRVLPIDTRRLHLLIVGRRLLGWIVIWCVLLLIHVVMIGRVPSSLRLDLLVCLVGIDQFAFAVHLRQRWQVLIMVLIIVASGVAKELIQRSPPTLEPWYAALFGLTGLVVAMLINHSTLLTRSGLYKPLAPPAFTGGFSADPATR